jgi:hypothetical protein
MEFREFVAVEAYYPFYVEKHGRYHIINFGGYPHAIFFDGKPLINDDISNGVTKLNGGRLIFYNPDVDTVDVYSSDGKLHRRDRGDGLESFRFIDDYVIYTFADDKLHIGFLSEYIEYGSVKDPRFKQQVLLKNIPEHYVSECTKSGIIQLDDNREKRIIDRTPLNVRSGSNDSKILDLKTGILINADFWLRCESISGKYILVRYKDRRQSIMSVNRSIEKAEGTIVGSFDVNSFTYDTVISFYNINTSTEILTEVRWILDDVVLLYHPLNPIKESYLVNLLNLTTIEIVDLYEAVPDEITEGYYFKDDSGTHFISERSMLRRARELLSPHTKTNLNTLGLVKEIPTSVTDRIGRYV